MADQQHNFTEEYRALFNSPLGADIIRSLKDLHDSLIVDGEASEQSDKGYGLLKEASGVMLAVSHLKGKGNNPKSRSQS